MVTASKEKQKALDAPAGMYVVTAAMIRDRGYTNLTELLDDIPGVEIQRKSVAEYQNYISLRGVQGNDRFIILMDGYRVSSCINTPMVVGTNYPLVDVKQVEIILGPASALYGADALSGVINIITKSGSELSGGSARASFGMYNTTDNSLVLGRRLHDKVALSVAAHFHHSDEPYLPDKYPKEFRWYNERYSKTGEVRQSAQLPNTIIDLGEPRPYATPTDSYWVHSRLTVGDFELGYMRSQEAHSSSLFGKPEYNLYVEDALYKTIIESMYAAHRYTSPGGRISLRTSLWRGYFEIHPDSKFINQFTTFGEGWKYEYGRSIKAEEQITVRLAEQMVLTGGLSYEDIESLPKTGDLPSRFDKDRPADLQQMHIPGTNIQDRDGNDLTVPSDFYYLQYQNIGTFLQLRGQLWDLIEPTLGARLDYNTRYGWTFNPRMGVVLSPLRTLKLKLLYGEAYLAPSPYNAYQHYGAFIPTTADGKPGGPVTGLTGPFWHLPNPDLDPEKLRSAEILDPLLPAGPARRLAQRLLHQPRERDRLRGQARRHLQGAARGLLRATGQQGQRLHGRGDTAPRHGAAACTPATAAALRRLQLHRRRDRRQAADLHRAACGQGWRRHQLAQADRLHPLDLPLADAAPALPPRGQRRAARHLLQPPLPGGQPLRALLQHLLHQQLPRQRLPQGAQPLQRALL